MKVVLEFEDDEKDARIYLNGKRYYLCLWDIYNYFRDIIKYTDDNPKIEEIDEKFWSILDDNHVDLFEVE